ncbi:MAG: dihydrodipicolinate synthase family protein [Planctomycetes bacterium]|nr:dihydrodipicolinate synthase family protein [Planctomycetota bacterium]
MKAGETFREVLRRGVVIPASPLALTASRGLDERRQRGLWRYYSAAGAGGIAVGVHTTQFEIREPQHGLLRPVLELAADEFTRLDVRRRSPLVRIAGICGPTRQAAAEARLAAGLGFHAGLVSLAALPHASDGELIRHLRTVAAAIPLVGFYLQPAVGGRVLSYGFWRRFAEIERAVAVKIAPFNRYRTIDVVRAVAESGRRDIALYTGNDDNIVGDLVTPFLFRVGGRRVERRIVGGLLGQWSVWTKKAVELLARCHRLAASGGAAPVDLLALGAELTDANAAVFDAAGGFAGCIPGIHEVLRRQGLLAGTWCLDRRAGLSPGQRGEIDRVLAACPHLADDNFVTEHRDEWLKD